MNHQIGGEKMDIYKALKMIKNRQRITRDPFSKK